MKRIFYYTTTAIIISCGITQAQTCVPTPTCSSLGYTSSTACDGGLKCPFGNYWNCDLANKINEVTTQLTELKNEIAQQQQQENCVIGAILYSDMSCSSTVVAGKTPIGVVVYIGPKGYQAIALESIGNGSWSSKSVDISTLPNYSQEYFPTKDYDSCESTEKIMAAGDKSAYPAAWVAHEYKTTGTQAGDWCLPAAGIFTSIYDNKDVINAGLSLADGSEFSDYYTDIWSSSEESSGYALYGDFYNGSFGLNTSHKSIYKDIRPVLEF